MALLSMRPGTVLPFLVVLVAALAPTGCADGTTGDTGDATDAGSAGDGTLQGDARASDGPFDSDAVALGDSSVVDATSGIDATRTTDGAADDGSLSGESSDGGDATDAAQGTYDGPSEIAYVATFLSGIGAFSLDPNSGDLVQLDGSPYAPHAGLYAVTRAPSGRFLYAVDTDSNQILGFRIAPGGVLAPLADFPVTTGTGPVSIAIDPQERFAYVGTSDPNASLYAYRMDPDGGGLAASGAPYILHSAADYIAAAPSGLFVYVCTASGIHAYAVDADAGALSELGTSPFGSPAVFRGSLVFHPGGRLLFAGGNGLNVFRADPATGVLEAVDGSPFTTDVGSDQFSTDLALDPSGRFLYAVHAETGHLSAFAIGDGGTVEALDGSPYDANTFPYSVAVDPASRFVLVGNDDVNKMTVFAIDPQSGALAPVAGSQFDVTGLQPEMVVVAR